MAASLAEQLAGREELSRGLVSLAGRVPDKVFSMTDGECLNVAASILYVTASMCSQETAPTTNTNAEQYKEGLEKVYDILHKLSEKVSKPCEDVDDLQLQQSIVGVIRVWDTMWSKWENKTAAASAGKMLSMEYFIRKHKDMYNDGDLPKMYESVADALAVIPEPDVMVGSATPDMQMLKPMPPPGKWAKEGNKHIAECVHSLNDNLLIVAQKIDTLNEMMFDETSDLPEDFTVQGYVHTNYLNYKTILDRLNEMDTKLKNMETSISNIVQSNSVRDDGAEPAAKKSRTEDDAQT
jgi:hypothetical protein